MSLYPMVRDLWRTLLASVPQGIIFSVLISLVILLKEEKSPRALLRSFALKIKSSRKYRCSIYFLIYLYILLYRTLISRDAVYTPLSNILGGWITTVNFFGEINYEVIGNIGVFIPFTLLLFTAFGDKFKGNKKILLFSAIYSLILSGFIEINQLIFKLGTLQLSDLAYNTLGGILGGLLYILILKIIKRHKKAQA